MGIFSRRGSARDRALIEQEKMNYFAREIANTIGAEYRTLQNAIDDRKSEGIHSAEFEDYESLTLMSLDQMCKFINRLLGQAASELRTSERVCPDSAKIKNLMDQLVAIKSPKANAIIADLEEVCIYYADSVRSGSFFMMPDATMESSRSYRGYLLGNKLNGDNKWGWEKDDKSPQEHADNSMSQFLGRFVTEVHDKVGASKILYSACLLAILLSTAWETAPERHSIR
jgi:hypothetical protein